MGFNRGSRLGAAMVRVLDEWATLDLVLAGRSLARFGDGEFELCEGRGIYFQPHHEALASALKGVLQHDSSNLLVAVPPVFSGTGSLNPRWTLVGSWRELAVSWLPFLDEGRTYGSSFVTRPEMVTHLFHGAFFRRWQDVWAGKKVVFVGNSMQFDEPGGAFRMLSPQQLSQHPLFEYADSVRVLKVPEVDVFNRYGAVLKACLDEAEDAVFLLSLGPTAVVLAAALSGLGRQAVDFGQLPSAWLFWARSVRPKRMERGRWSRLLEDRAFKRLQVFQAAGLVALEDRLPAETWREVAAPIVADRTVVVFGSARGALAMSVLADTPGKLKQHLDPRFESWVSQAEACLTDDNVGLWAFNHLWEVAAFPFALTTPLCLCGFRGELEEPTSPTADFLNRFGFDEAVVFVFEEDRRYCKVWPITKAEALQVFMAHGEAAVEGLILFVGIKPR